MAASQCGVVRLFISHGAAVGSIRDPDAGLGVLVDWFIVEPRESPDEAVESLRRAGRTVVELEVEPYTGRATKIL